MSNLSPTDSHYNINLIKELCTKIYSDMPIVGKLAVCQAILESRLKGTPSKLALMANNLFGIKGRGTGGTVYMPTTEYVNGKKETVEQGFAKNSTLEDSIYQHRHLMTQGTSWDKDQYKSVLTAKTFEDAAREIAECGYATDKNYTKELIDIYNEYL